MGNFRNRASEMLEDMPDKYGYFSEVMDAIVRMGNYKTYFHGDLLNIEEALSVVEMERFLGVVQPRIDISEFIKDVISHSTPNILERDLNFNNFEQVLFGTTKFRSISYEPYGYFLCSILRLELERSNYYQNEPIRKSISCKSVLNTGYQYQLITLNYDRVFEICQESLEEQFGLQLASRINRPLKDDNYHWKDTYICKLHGCVSSKIVPPTWNKGSETSILGDWQCAHKMLSEATHIRIIGYSFPESDSYIKYLLKSALRISTRLKSIDYIILGSDVDAIERCKKFVAFPVRIVKGNAIDYLKEVRSLVAQTKDESRESRSPSNLLSFDKLEKGHERFCKANS